MRLRLFWVGLLLAGPALGEPLFPLIHSEQPIALDSLFALALRNNPSHRQTLLDTRLSEIGKINAVGNFLPQVSLGMQFGETHYRNPTFVQDDGSVATYPVTYEETYVMFDSLGNAYPETRTVTRDVPEGKSRSSSMYLSLDEEIFDGGRRIFLYRMAKTQERINDLSVEESRKALARGIAQQVVVVLTQEKLLELNKRLRDQRQDAYNLAKARFDVGAVTELDVLQAQIELGSAENVITSTERDRQAQREALNQMLGIDLKSSFPLAEADQVTPFEFNVDSLVAQAYRYRTDLRIAELTITRANHNLNLYKADYLPKISLGAQWTQSEASGTSEPWTLDPRNRNTTYNLGLRWNLFDGFTREYNLVTQRVSRDRAVEAERQLRLGLEKDVRDAYYNLEKVYNQLQITGRNRDLADRTLNLERERYRLGATSQLGLRDAQVTYARAETENLQKTLEYQSSLIALELAIGKPVR